MMKTIEPTIANLRMLASIKNQAWMIRPEYANEYALSALQVPEITGEFDAADFYPMREEPSIDESGVGSVAIKGALLNECPAIYEKLGLATRYETIIEETQGLIDAGATSIIFHINSPGGTVAGNTECCRFMRGLGVPTSSHCSGLACSAAYKLAASTEYITASQSAEVGNIGTILSWQDCSEFWRENGIEFKALTNKGADLKSTFHLEPDSTQLMFLQQSIDEAGDEFRTHVEANRDVDQEVFRAGWYHGDKALSLGLIDGITDAKGATSRIGSRQRNLTFAPQNLHQNSAMIFTDKSAKEKIAANEARITELEADISTKDQHIEQLTSELVERDETIVEHVASIASRDEQIATLTVESEQSEANIASLTAELATAKDSAASEATTMLASIGQPEPIEINEESEEPKTLREQYNSLTDEKAKADFRKAHWSELISN